MIAARIAAMVLWFLIVVGPHLFCRLAGRRDLVAPLFLAGIGRIVGLLVVRDGQVAPGRLLLVANHLSWLDILALAGTTRAAFVAHGGLAQFGLLRWLCEQNDTVFIARDRRATVAEQVGQIEAALAQRRLVIFPEGTTGDGRTMLAFKSALLSTAERIAGQGEALTIQPVALDYDEASAIAWFDAEPGMANFVRILARTRPIRLTVRLGAPLAGHELADRKAMASAARCSIAQQLRL